MKANEYINKYGVDCAKEILKHNQELMNIGFFTDLKHLVESHELVEKLGGVEMAEYEYMVSDSYSDPYWIRVKQAIADIESCQ